MFGRVLLAPLIGPLRIGGGGGGGRRVVVVAVASGGSGGGVPLTSLRVGDRAQRVALSIPRAKGPI